jgi:hypothetical protein
MTTGENKEARARLRAMMLAALKEAAKIHDVEWKGRDTDVSSVTSAMRETAGMLFRGALAALPEEDQSTITAQMIRQMTEQLSLERFEPDEDDRPN